MAFTLSTYSANTCLHPFQKTNPNSFSNFPSKKSSPICPRISATANLAKLNVAELESRKHGLLRSIQETQRGFSATAEQRSSIEEALVSVEEFDAGSRVDLLALDGTWRLNYTSAADVLFLFEAADRLPLFQVGQIFQKFECQDGNAGGIVRNVVRWSLSNLLEEQEGATLLVSAKFDVLTKRNIYLQFNEVAVENIKISEELQAWIAPAILPRSFLSLQVLQFLRSLRAQLPLGGRPDKYVAIYPKLE